MIELPLNPIKALLDYLSNEDEVISLTHLDERALFGCLLTSHKASIEMKKLRTIDITSLSLIGVTELPHGIKGVKWTQRALSLYMEDSLLIHIPYTLNLNPSLRPDYIQHIKDYWPPCWEDITDLKLGIVIRL